MRSLLLREPLLSCVPHRYAQEVSRLCLLAAGTYKVVPSTYLPDAEGAFTVTIATRVDRYSPGLGQSVGDLPASALLPSPAALPILGTRISWWRPAVGPVPWGPCRLQPGREHGGGGWRHRHSAQDRLGDQHAASHRRSIHSQEVLGHFLQEVRVRAPPVSPATSPSTLPVACAWHACAVLYLTAATWQG